jgi:hypothetical protein
MLIESVADAELLREAERYAALSETERILERIQQLEEQKAQKENEKELLLIQKQEEERIYKEYTDKINALEKQRTATLDAESGKRKRIMRDEILVMQQYLQQLQAVQNAG